MTITQKHVDFWMEKKGLIPSFTPEKGNRKPVDINELIPKEAWNDELKYSQVLNTVQLVKSYRKRGPVSLRKSLAEIALSPQCTNNPKRRSSLAKKWLARLEGE